MPVSSSNSPTTSSSSSAVQGIQTSRASTQIPLWKRALQLTIISTLLLGFTCTGVFLYILVDSDSSFSRWVVQNTPLDNYLSLATEEEPTTVTTTPLESTVEPVIPTSKAVNDILGLPTEPTTRALTFATPGAALTIPQTVDKVLPSVISISVSPTDSSNPFQQVAAGSGYFVSEDGLIITNKHVISLACGDAPVRVTGLDHDQNAYDLELLSVDPIEDIAILQARSDEDMPDFPAVEFADSRSLQLGAEVLAVGNTLGTLQNTVTRGIISGLNRTLFAGVPDECTRQPSFPESLIQTDAAINQGNSGGPLFNSAGQLIGMNTYGIPEAQNIGLAIPSTRIRAALLSFENNNKIIRPRLGVLTQSLNSLVTRQNPWIPVQNGELIYSGDSNVRAVTPNSAADQAGLREGDIILSLNGRELVSTDADPTPLRSLLLNLQPGERVTLSVLRATDRDGNTFRYAETPEELEVTLGGTSYDL